MKVDQHQVTQQNGVSLQVATSVTANQDIKRVMTQVNREGLEMKQEAGLFPQIGHQATQLSVSLLTALSGTRHSPQDRTMDPRMADHRPLKIFVSSPTVQLNCQ